MVKEQLATRSFEKSYNAAQNSTVQNLEKEVGSILDNLFSSEAK
jgi:hypothetical protein